MIIFIQMTSTNQIHPNQIRQIILLAVIILLGWLLYKEMHFMLGAFLGAIALYSLLRKAMYKLTYTYKWKKGLAATLLMLMSFIIIVLPFAWIVKVLIDKVSPFIADTSYLQAAADKINNYLLTRFNIEILDKANIGKITTAITNIAPKILSGTLSSLSNLVIMYFILWFMLMSGGNMEKWLLRNLPLKYSNRTIILNDLRDMVRSNAFGIPVLAILQGIMAIIGYMIFGVKDPVLWGLITGICSVIPFVGTMAAWVPIAIYAFANGEQNNGIGLVFWGLIVIGASDNVFRLLLQKRMGNVHPLITIFGVIIGINLFGFLGLIFGPLLISLFILLMRIYTDEFVDDHPDTGHNEVFN